MEISSIRMDLKEPISTNYTHHFKLLYIILMGVGGGTDSFHYSTDQFHPI